MPEMLVRLKRGKKTFEVMVEEGLVPKYREGKLTQADVVVAPIVFTNVSQGVKASADQLKAAFETDDLSAVIDLILKKGEAQESASERKDKMDGKRRELINAIHKAFVSPDGRPLPVPRIENALDKARPRIDPDRDAEHQLDAIAPKLADVMSMKRAKTGIEAVISVPILKAGAAASIIRKHAKVHREAYGVQAKFDVEIASYDLVCKELAKATGGDYDIQMSDPSAVESGKANVASAPEPANKGKKKKKNRN